MQAHKNFKMLQQTFTAKQVRYLYLLIVINNYFFLFFLQTNYKTCVNMNGTEENPGRNYFLKTQMLNIYSAQSWQL